ncbi:MAG: hypothetical protein ACYTGB_15535, partial [Planctomycetota bacterium]
MKLMLGALLSVLAAAPAAGGEPPSVTGIKALHRDGQTFVTWKDAAEGEAGAKFRYSLYRSAKPITQENLAAAELCYPGVLNNSCKQFGHAFWMKDRLNPEKPFNVIQEGGKPLPMWSGLAVRTVAAEGKSFYAVMVTDEKLKPVGRIVPGQSATTEAVEEKGAPIQPIKIGDSKTRGASARSCAITGKPDLPLWLALHGSQSRGGAASSHGDLYIYFGTPEMGWRDGIPGIFSLIETHMGENSYLKLNIRDSIEPLTANGVVETCWFGYWSIPVGAEHKEPRAYPFTERRVTWIVDWVTKKFKADPQRVYSGGQSMGGMGSTQFSFRHPEIFAAVYPKLGRVRQTWLPVAGPSVVRKGNGIHWRRWKKPAPMFDGKTDYFKDKMDAIKYASEHHEDLSFYGWCFGRTDNVAPWSDQIEMVEALTKNHHGFAFSWNNHGHSSAGGAAIKEI